MLVGCSTHSPLTSNKQFNPEILQIVDERNIVIDGELGEWPGEPSRLLLWNPLASNVEKDKAWLQVALDKENCVLLVGQYLKRDVDGSSSLRANLTLSLRGLEDDRKMRIEFDGVSVSGHSELTKASIVAANVEVLSVYYEWRIDLNTLSLDPKDLKINGSIIERVGDYPGEYSLFRSIQVGGK